MVISLLVGLLTMMIAASAVEMPSESDTVEYRFRFVCVDLAVIGEACCEKLDSIA